MVRLKITDKVYPSLRTRKVAVENNKLKDLSKICEIYIREERESGSSECECRCECPITEMTTCGRKYEASRNWERNLGNDALPSLFP